jgi:hypothetical protein
MFVRRRGPWALIAWVAVLTIGGVCVPRRAQAQSATTTQDQRLEDLKRQLAELEQTTAAQIAAIRQQIAALSPSGQPAAAAAPQPAAPVPTGAAPETFARDRETVARVNNVPVDPAMQGFFPIPGTPARLKIDGYAKLDAIIDTKPAGNPDRFIPSTIPIGLTDAQQTPSTTLHVRQTRVNLDFRSPTELGSDFRTFAEIDFFGPDAPFDPRMRHFYGQLANFLVGQTWTTFTDVDAFPDSLDDQGSNVAVKLRQAQVRYTQKLKAGQNIAFAIERPLTETRQIDPSGAPYSPAPDVVVRYRYDHSRGHLQATSLFRTLGYRMEDRRETTLGIGGNVAGAWKIGGDTIMGYTAFGKGIARYVENLVGTNSDVDLNDAGTDLEALSAFGAYGAYTHKWSTQFRSTGVFGYTKVTPSAPQPATSFLDSYYGMGNLLWNPAGSLDLGIEYIYGTHDVKDGEGAHATRIQFAAKYDFFRKRPIGQ